MSAAALLSTPDWNPGLTVEVVSNENAFVALEPEWDRVVGKTASGHPFLRHDWVRSWWEAFRHGHQLHVLVVREGADAIALAPLMISRSRMLGVPVRRLEFLANDHVPRFDFIVARRHEAAYRVIWEHLTS